MTNDKKDKSKWVDAVTRMIELTQRGEMRWQSVEPTGTVSEEKNRTSAVFQAIYNGKAIRLYERDLKEKQPLSTEER